MRLVVSTILVAALTTFTAEAALPERHHIDQRDVDRMKGVSPRALALLEEGEARMRIGNLQQAAESLEQAYREYPYSALVARRRCQVLNALGRHEEALKSCRSALSSRASPMDLRAIVGVRMSEPGEPSFGTLAESVKFTNQARQYGSDQPWAHAADCDIAARLGNEQLFRKCLAELERVAPGHYETVRARSMLAGSRPGLVWAGFIGIALLAIGTLARALWQLVRDRSVRPAALAGTIVLGLCFEPASAGAQSSSAESTSATSTSAPTKPTGISQLRIDHDDPERSVPTPEQRDKNPLEFGYHLQDLTVEAAAAVKRGDHRAAVKYYRALAKAVPDRAVPFAKACESYEVLGERENALKWCGIAVALPGVTVDDSRRFARLTLAKEGPLTLDERQDLDELIAHLKQQPGAETAGELIQCELGMKTGELAQLEQCSAALVARAPDDATTIYYQWALALKQRDFAEADRHIERAGQAHSKSETLEHMERATSELELAVWRKRLLVGASISMAAGLAYLLSRAIRSRRARPRRRPDAKSRRIEAGTEPAPAMGNSDGE